MQYPCNIIHPTLAKPVLFPGLIHMCIGVSMGQDYFTISDRHSSCTCFLSFGLYIHLASLDMSVWVGGGGAWGMGEGDVG